MEYRYGELFCGPGGLAFGALQASVSHNGEEYRIRHQWATDYHADSCETYRHNICPSDPESVICRPVQELKFSQLDQFDALTFGFPCNDFSVVGEKKGIHGEYGPLYKYGVNALAHFKPQWFLTENVSGLKNIHQGNFFEQILEELERPSTDISYNITAHLYKFEEYGVPQRRHRIIIIGIRSDLNMTFQVPEPNHLKYITARDAIENPQIPDTALNNELTNQSPHVIERLRYIQPGENVFNADMPDHLKIKTKGVTISSIYKRLNPDLPAYTVTGSGGGGTHMYHWSEPRALTNRERARLQTFPDNFYFIGSKESVRRQIGMAVPVKGAKLIFEAVLKTLAGIEYPTVPASIERKRIGIANNVQGRLNL